MTTSQSYTNIFVLNQLKENLCSLCLCQNRLFVRNVPVLERVMEYFPNLLLDFDMEADRTCWECIARLKQLLRFHNQVQLARQTLEHVVSTARVGYYRPVINSLSRLVKRKITIMGIEPVPTVTSGNLEILQKGTTPVKVKKEIDDLATPEDYFEVPIQNCQDFIKEECISNELIDSDSLIEANDSSSYDPISEIKIESLHSEHTTSKQLDLNEIVKSMVVQNISTKSNSTDLDEKISSMVIINPMKENIQSSEAQNTSSEKIIVQKHILKNMLQKTETSMQKKLTLHPVLQKEVNSKLRPIIIKPQTTLRVYSSKNKNPVVITKNKISIINSELSLEEQRSLAENEVKKVRIPKNILMQLREKEMKYISTFKTGFNCEKCICNIENEEDFKKHMEQHDRSAGVFMCDICTLRFEDTESLISHHQKHYIVYSCNRCPRDSFLCRVWSTMALHLRVHQDPPWLPCHDCGTAYVTKEKLREHVDSMHRLKCPFCAKKKFTSQEILDDHHRLYHKEMECEKCHMKVKGDIFLRLHMRSDACRMCHEDFQITGARDTQPYCVQCDKFFVSYNGLVIHMRDSKTHKSDRYYVCDMCNKCYAQKLTLIKHISFVHDKITVPCPSCDKVFPDKHRLKRHVNKVHLGKQKERTHICHVCGKGFTITTLLKKHLLIHTGERPFQCEQCEWNFTQKSTLRTHIRLKHNKDRSTPSGAKNKSKNTPNDAESKVETLPGDADNNGNNKGNNTPSDAENKRRTIPSHVDDNGEITACESGTKCESTPSGAKNKSKNTPNDAESETLPGDADNDDNNKGNNTPSDAENKGGTPPGEAENNGNNKDYNTPSDAENNGEISSCQSGTVSTKGIDKISKGESTRSGAKNKGKRTRSRSSNKTLSKIKKMNEQDKEEEES